MVEINVRDPDCFLGEMNGKYRWPGDSAEVNQYEQPGSTRAYAKKATLGKQGYGPRVVHSPRPGMNYSYGSE